MLEVVGLEKRFGGVVAANDLSFKVGDAELVGLIGPNGAGKTTVFNLVSGVLKPDRGRIYFNSQNITGKSVHKIASLGLTRTFQQNMLFDNQTCFDNLRLASHLFEDKAILSFAFGVGVGQDKEQFYEQRIHTILDTMGLSDYAETLAGSLPNGIKRILGVAMAWATEPKLLLLDEPAAGMTPAEIQNLKSLINRLIQSGASILLVEHNVQMVMEICHRVLVLNFGKLIAEGTPDQVMGSKDVISAYLGE